VSAWSKLIRLPSIFERVLSSPLIATGSRSRTGKIPTYIVSFEIARSRSVLCTGHFCVQFKLY
jgi:hypothetical protein